MNQSSVSKNKNKVLVISYEYPPVGGGAGIVARDLFECLNKDDIKVDLILESDEVKNVNFSEGSMVFQTTNGFTDFKFWNNILKLRKKIKNYDHIILNDFYSKYIASYFFSKNEQKKCILVLHGSEPEVVYEIPKVKYKIIRFSSMFNRLLDNCNHVVAVSNFMKDKFILISKRQDLKQKVSIIHNWVNNDIFYPMQKEERSLIKKEFLLKNGITSDTTILLTTGRIIKEKGFDSIFYSIKDLLNKNKLVWLIIGDGDYKSTLVETINKNNLECKVLFEGWKSNDELRKYYCLSDVFCLLSDLSESFGLCYLEAMTCGTVPIGYNRAGVRELIENNKNGFLLADREELTKIIDNQDYLSIDKNDLIQDASRFSSENSCAKYRRLMKL